jgi:hypothetical protein
MKEERDKNIQIKVAHVSGIYGIVVAIIAGIFTIAGIYFSLQIVTNNKSVSNKTSVTKFKESKNPSLDSIHKEIEEKEKLQELYPHPNKQLPTNYFSACNTIKAWGLDLKWQYKIWSHLMELIKSDNYPTDEFDDEIYKRTIIDSYQASCFLLSIPVEYSEYDNDKTLSMLKTKFPEFLNDLSKDSLEKENLLGKWGLDVKYWTIVNFRIRLGELIYVNCDANYRKGEYAEIFPPLVRNSHNVQILLECNETNRL